MNFKCILTVIAIGTAGIIGASCTIIPMWASVAHAVGDTVLSLATGKSSGEHGLSLLTGEDCQFIRVIDDASICMSSKEYVEYLSSLNCDVYVWNIFNRVSCEKET